MPLADKDTDLLDVPAESTAIATRQTDEFASMVERLAANPAVDVTKLEKIIELQERILAHNAKAAFDAAFSQMQPEIPEIDERGQILVKGQRRSTYAKLEDINRVIKPILKQFGFSIRHRTEWPVDKTGIIRVIGILGHKDGHSEESAFEAPMDRSEFRTDIQSEGSTVSYGRRYTTIDLLNISTRQQDDDGQKAGHKQADVKAPAGFSDWWDDMQACADEGLGKLEAAWNKSKGEFRAHLINTNKAGWQAIKAKASAVQS